LQAQGVTISACASVHTFEDDILATPIAPLSSGHLLDLEPVSILGQIEQAKQGLALQKLLGASAAQPREVMRILASAEPLAVHMPWRAIPDANDVVVSDSAFSAFTRWRLGLPLCSEAAQCGRVADKGIQATQCGKSLGGRGDHITLCRLGASASGTHSAFAELVKTAAKEAGMLALREVVILALARRKCTGTNCTCKAGNAGHNGPLGNARIDVAAWGLVAPAPGELLLDVTIRHPWASIEKKKLPEGATIQQMQTQLEEVFSRAHQDKAKRYPDTGGHTVTCMTLSTWGSLSQAARDTLYTLATLAALRERDVHQLSTREGTWLRG